MTRTPPNQITPDGSSTSADGPGEIVLSEQDIEEFVSAPNPSTHLRVIADARKRSKLIWYRIVHWYQHRSLLERVIYMLAYLYLPYKSASALGWSWKAIGALVFLIVLQGRKAWKEFAPSSSLLVHQNYLERKLRLTRILEEMRRADDMSELQLERFREDVLALVTNYVRSYRFDLRGKKIFANLLIPAGDELVVVARNERHRVVGARYRKEDLLAGRVFDSGELQVSGNIHQEFPWCKALKKYKSVMALPIWFESRLVGVLTIDSQLEYHFDDEAENLFYYLGPYLSVLGWTLSGRHAIDRKKLGD
jgi:hypothetical protein